MRNKLPANMKAEVKKALDFWRKHCGKDVEHVHLFIDGRNGKVIDHIYRNGLRGKFNTYSTGDGVNHKIQ